MTGDDPDVLIVGAGPVGLWLASELALAGIATTVVEKRARRTNWSRALTVHARTLEVFAMRGAVEPWLAEGVPVPTTHFGMLNSRIDLRGLDSDFPFTLFIPQLRTEELLEARARDLGVTIWRPCEVTDLGADPGGVWVDVTEPAGSSRMHVRYVVGCDGKHSVVRASAGIAYDGAQDAAGCLLGDVKISPAAGDPDPHALTLHAEAGSFYGVRMSGEQYRLIIVEHGPALVPADTPLDLDEFRTRVKDVMGTDFGMRDPAWLTRLSSATYQVDRYRAGRVLLAGDAAHVHFPMGGQGLNLGVQDAMNLGWKLAAVLHGTAPEEILESYHDERHAAGALVIENTLSQTAVVAAPGRPGEALRDWLDVLLARYPAVNAEFARLLSGLGISYTDRVRAEAGTRVPNHALTDGSHLFDHLHDGRFVAYGVPREGLERGLGPSWSRAVTATAAPSAEGWHGGGLVRPDGYLAAAAGPEQVLDVVVQTLRRWLPSHERKQ
ncbi:FAD-dependent monooxygenase [Dactylosporangium sp. CA-092794]|uniref:FAD-dependent monooxygenase n=1 Tax=Dactylosporangium sp. CA-092794 TaxID=3239929 RepID=UPI003D907FCD